MRSIACVKMDCILLRAFPGLCHGSPRVTCACQEFGDRAWLGGVSGCKTKWPCPGKRARGSRGAACAPSVGQGWKWEF